MHIIAEKLNTCRAEPSVVIVEVSINRDTTSLNLLADINP
jgi:hypothetical protein